VPLGFALGLLYIVFGKPHAALLPFGMALAAVGIGVRAWAAGHIDKNSDLCIAGPYAHTRNPLYLGSLFLALGFALAAGWVFIIPVAAFFLLVYSPVIGDEAERMARLFPDRYPEYAANVPLMWPRIAPWRPSGSFPVRSFSARLYLRNAEWKAALGFLGGLCWLALRLRLGF
jgi:protein-S-isoprenylcysteine O-methyltransferase Ste14